MIDSAATEHPLYILMISVHGLIRSHDLELGRDADTGGQTTYVVELARTLGQHEGVEKVDLLTRLVDDSSLARDYARPEEAITDKVRIIRLGCGPKRYIRKELLWPHLDQMVDRCLHYLRQQGRLPDVIHSHYADAGYVGKQLSTLLGIPLIHTGHSLGMPKRMRLLASGRKESAIDRQFNFPLRIAAEEEIVNHCSLVVTSTRQEIEEQYGLYQNHNPRKCSVIPPGTNTSRFSPRGRSQFDADFLERIDRFFHQPDKPLILAISRPDRRKNLKLLLAAYGRNPALQAQANLLVVAGAREDIRDLEESQRAVMNDLLLDIDKYDLWGKVAIPKHICQDEIPELYRLAARRQGVFINPALTEPFGLTLIEAAASGLPVVAPDDGGPRDIIANCRNGQITNTLDCNEMALCLLNALSDRKQWRNWSRNGVTGVKRHYQWTAHVEKYVKEVCLLLRRDRKRLRRQQAMAITAGKSPMPLAGMVLISDIDNTLIGNRSAQEDLVAWLRRNNRKLAFGIATGRSLESAVAYLGKHKVPIPDILITSVGSEISYGSGLIPDLGWRNHIRHKWRRADIAQALKAVPGLQLQAEENQREFKLSYVVSPAALPSLANLHQLLREQDLHAQLIYSHDEYLDVLPMRASKGHAVRYLAYKWGLPLKNFVVAGDSGNDCEMLVGDTLAIVVGNHSPDLNHLRGMEQVYFARGNYAAGILEGLVHYGRGEGIAGYAPAAEGE